MFLLISAKRGTMYTKKILMIMTIILLFINPCFANKEFVALGVKLGMKESEAKKLLPDAKKGDGAFMVKNINFGSKTGILLFYPEKGIISEIKFFVSMGKDASDSACIGMTEYLKMFFVEEYKVKYSYNDIQLSRDQPLHNEARIVGSNGIFRVTINNYLKFGRKKYLPPNYKKTCVIEYTIEKWKKSYFTDKIKKGLLRK